MEVNKMVQVKAGQLYRQDYDCACDIILNSNEVLICYFTTKAATRGIYPSQTDLGKLVTNIFCEEQ